METLKGLKVSDKILFFFDQNYYLLQNIRDAIQLNMKLMKVNCIFIVG